MSVPEMGFPKLWDVKAHLRTRTPAFNSQSLYVYAEKHIHRTLLKSAPEEKVSAAVGAGGDEKLIAKTHAKEDAFEALVKTNAEVFRVSNDGRFPATVSLAFEGQTQVKGLLFTYRVGICHLSLEPLYTLNYHVLEEYLLRRFSVETTRSIIYRESRKCWNGRWITFFSRSSYHIATLARDSWFATQTSVVSTQNPAPNWGE